MKKIYLDILDKNRLNIFKRLYKIFNNTYYLAGGTALALQIRHRKSLDFDLFKNKEITLHTKQRLIKEFTDHAIQTLVDTSDELSIVLDNETKISLINYYWDPVLPLIKIHFLIPLLSIKEIAATKSYAIGRRGNYKDYFDLYTIIKNKFTTLQRIIGLCEKKYGDIFSKRMFLEQLIYLDDVPEDRNMLFLEQDYASCKQIEEFFKAELKKIKTKLI